MIEETRKFYVCQTYEWQLLYLSSNQHSHAVSINVELERDSLTSSRNSSSLQEAEGIILLDDPANLKYPLQSEVEDHDEVYVNEACRDDQFLTASIFG